MVIAFVLAGLAASAAAAAAVASHSIILPNIPYHRQITPYACGDASAEMVLHSFGHADVDQRAIIDVQRTSSTEGTLSYDVVRGLRFSELSKSPISGLYPQETPTKGGWDQRGPSQAPRLGLPAFDFRAPDFGAGNCWTKELGAMVNAGFPVIVLQHYSKASPGGHFRVVVGVTQQGQEGDVEFITQHDPWDRDNADSKELPGLPRQAPGSFGVAGRQPHVIRTSREEFCWRWNYPEHNVHNVTYEPFFGAAAAPWRVEVAVVALAQSGYNVTARATYAYPLSTVLERHKALAAVNCEAELVLPSFITTKAPMKVTFGTIAVGATSEELTWTVETKRDPPEAHLGSDYESVAVRAWGTIKSQVPDTFAGANKAPYPSYSYTDNVGGVGFAHMTPNFMYN
jgi:Peptidase_C39 like family